MNFHNGIFPSWKFSKPNGIFKLTNITWINDLCVRFPLRISHSCCLFWNRNIYGKIVFPAVKPWSSKSSCRCEHYVYWLLGTSLVAKVACTIFFLATEYRPCNCPLEYWAVLESFDFVNGNFPSTHLDKIRIRVVGSRVLEHLSVHYELGNYWRTTV